MEFIPVLWSELAYPTHRDVGIPHLDLDMPNPYKRGKVSLFKAPLHKCIQQSTRILSLAHFILDLVSEVSGHEPPRRGDRIFTHISDERIQGII